jgi:hypothetical protein
MENSCILTLAKNIPYGVVNAQNVKFPINYVAEKTTETYVADAQKSK